MPTSTFDFQFFVPTKIRFGSGALQEIQGEVEGYDARQLMVVTDQGIIDAGLLERLKVVLGMFDGAVGKGKDGKRGSKKWNLEIFSEISPNPKDREIINGYYKAREKSVELIISLGGGSPIDAAKGIAALAGCGDDQLSKYYGKNKLSAPALPHIAIPTTAGTGSEATFSSVISDTEEEMKKTMKTPLIAPSVAVLDPELTLGLPADITAATGMDALTHAIEAFTAKNKSYMSDTLALEAARLIYHYLLRAYQEPADQEAREKVLLGSLLAGIAFSQSDVGACHCMAEALGSKHDAPHGTCNAVLLPYVMQYNQEHAREAYSQLAKAFGAEFSSKEEGAEIAVEKIATMARLLNLPSFRELGIEPEYFELLAEFSVQNISTQNNPRPMTKENYLEIFEMAYHDGLNN